MSELLKNEKEIVVPGEEIVKSMEFLPGRNTFREGEAIISKKVGLVNLDHRVVSVIPLSSPYIPKEGDMVVGEVTDIQGNGWVVNIDAPHDAFLPLSGVREYIDTRRTSLTRFYSVGDLIYAKVHAVQGKSTYLSMQDIKAKKFSGGRIIRINPAKVPRLIGKEGSMITLLKERTGCRINAGQNGRVWVEGEGMHLCERAIQMIENEAAKEGLTDRVTALLEKEGIKPVKREEPQVGSEEPLEEPEPRAEEML